jgi:NADPH:quinone reductase-like Zn-dependent oxidoreductase
MHAVRLEEYGDPEVMKWVEADAPQAGPGEIAIAIRAATVGGFDLQYRQGRMAGGRPGMPKNFGAVPFQLGREGAGEVVEVGAGIERFSAGDRVVVMPSPACGQCFFCRRGQGGCCSASLLPGMTRFGTQAERIVVPAVGALPAPEGLSWEESAASIHNYATVWHALFGRGELAAGETVLITGAGGGLGAAAIALARLASAKTIIALTGVPAKAPRLRDIGADVVLNWREQDIPTEVRKVTGIGVDVALDIVGGDQFTIGFESLRVGGTLVAAAEFGGRTIDQFSLGRLLGTETKIVGSRSSTPLEQETVLALIGKGAIKPFVADVMPMAETAEAHRRLESGQVAGGKIVLVP